ncbi:MAG: hypothetical protein HFI09_03825 [Bacilli bacterium]|nr:hypothetical protein [Bacilli bacterium]
MKEFWFVVSWNPWFNHGNDFNVGASAGVFAFGNANGQDWANDSFRVVLKVTMLYKVRFFLRKRQ